MEYKRIGNTIIARFDIGEEIHQSVKELALRENIRLASISALGAVREFTVGVYDLSVKQYFNNTFKGAYEITSLTGTVNTMNGEYYCHLHLSAADGQGHVFGGHLDRAVVSPTCEMVINVIDGVVDRRRDEDLGINLLKF